MAQAIEWSVVALAVILSVIYLARRLKPGASGGCDGCCEGCKLHDPSNCKDYKPPKS